MKSNAGKGRLVAFSLAFFLVLADPSLILAEESGNSGAGTDKKIEYKFSIQVNVVRICANGRFFDLLEADTAGAGAWIKPYVVEVVDLKGKTVTCETVVPEPSTRENR